MSQKTIELVSAGYFSTIQDRGRHRFRRYGMPACGAADVRSHDFANAILGNSPDAATIECTLNGPTIRFAQRTWFAITGRDPEIHLDGVCVKPWQAHLSERGATLSVRVKTGLRCYIAFEGGIGVPLLMGSRSTYCAASTGGHEGRALKPKDRLVLNPGVAPPGSLACDTSVPVPNQWNPPNYCCERALRVVLGPQHDLFCEEAIETLLSSEYKVTNHSDRMGVRLDGALLKHKSGADIVSDGTLPGAIQVPGHGLPIVLLADCQTTGGYTKIACVISADLPLLAQKAPGESVRFCKVSTDEAIEAARQQAEEVAVFRKMLLEQAKTRAARARHYSVTLHGNVYSVTVEPH